MRSEQEKLVYPDAAEALIAQFESRRRRRIKGEVDWGLPDRAASLAPGKRATVQPFNAGYRFSAFGAPAKDANTKLDVIAKELEGEPELHFARRKAVPRSNHIGHRNRIDGPAERRPRHRFRPHEVHEAGHDPRPRGMLNVHVHIGGLMLFSQLANQLVACDFLISV